MELHEIIDRLEAEGGFEEEIEALGRFDKGALRKQAAKSTELENRVKELEGEIAKRDEAPKRQTAFEKYGIDFESLRAAEKEKLESYDGELTDEAIAEFVEKYDLPTIESEGSDEGGEEAPAEQIAAAARRGANQGSRVPKVTPADVAEWPADRWVKFADANPDAAEALRRGEEVTGVTG